MREIRYRHESGQLPPSLERVPFLQGLEESMADTLLTDAVLLECDPGDTLISEGDDSRFFCILLKGAVDILKDGEKVNTIRHSGEILGEMALATENPRSASVVAKTHAFCLKVEPDFLDGLNEAERNGFFAKLYQFVVRLLGERLEQSSNRIAQLEEKVATFSGGSTEDADGDGPKVYRI